jgi:hypothetical protein
MTFARCLLGPLLFSSPVLLCAACEAGTPPPAPAAAAPSVAAPPSPAAAPAPSAAAGGAAAGSASYGAQFTPGPTVALTALLSNPKQYADQSVITEGHVQRACSRKGCWMEIGEGDTACRVTFKDYGFFVPTDSAGAQARVQGRITTQRVEPSRVAHLEGEGARFRNREADGSATEVQFIASAVQLTRSGS